MHRCFMIALALVLSAATCFADVIAPRTKLRTRSRTPRSLSLRAARTAKPRLGASALRSSARRDRKWTWTDTITTNELNQITKISTGISTNGVTNVVCIIWNDNVVPLKYRETFLSMTDDEKGNAISDVPALWTENPTVAPVYPKEVAPDSGTDDNLTKETREIQLRW